jgi:hypothetical protein
MTMQRSTREAERAGHFSEEHWHELIRSMIEEIDTQADDELDALDGIRSDGANGPQALL